MRVSCFKGYSLCIFIVFSCIGILTDCLLFLVIYSFMDICERICREMHTYVSDRDLYAFETLYLLSQLFQYLLYFLKELSYVRSVHKSMVYSESDGHYQSSFAWHYFAGIHQRIV